MDQTNYPGSKEGLLGHSMEENAGLVDDSKTHKGWKNRVLFNEAVFLPQKVQVPWRVLQRAYWCFLTNHI